MCRMGLEELGGCTGYPFPGEELYVAEGRRSCVSLILVSQELYVAIPGLGGAVCRNSCVLMSAEVSCPSEYAQAQVVSSAAGAPRSVVS